jgi:protein gp37
MGQKSEIQWTDATWNIARGCVKVDADCKFCYMYRDSMDSTRYNPLNVIRTKTVFDMPLKLKEPSKIFTCSLTDFFLPEIDSYRGEAWEIMRKTRHTYQILTKRPERIYDNLPEFWDEIKDRVWLGTSVGSADGIKRIL